MRLNRTLLCVLCAVAASAPCHAERRHDDGADGTRDPSLWSETESRDSSRTGKSKCGISESAGKIRIDSKKGKGGAAAYTSAWSVDWTDSFVLELEHELKSSRPSKTTQSATSGMALGFGAFDAASGWTDGVNLVVERTKTARSLTATVRIAGVVVDSTSATLDAGAHDLKLVWTSFGSAVSLAVQVDGSSTPILTLEQLDVRFAGHEAEGMGVSLFGTSAGNFKFEASFDNVSFSGDDFNDSDDSGFNDDDGADDADEHGSSEGDSGSRDSAGAELFAAGLDFIAAASSLPSLEAEADVEAGVSIVKALQWDSVAGELVQIVVNSSTGEILSTRSWVPTTGQAHEYADAISVIGAVTVSPSDAVAQALAASPAGAGVHSIELDEHSGTPSWKLEVVAADGSHLEVVIAAN